MDTPARSWRLFRLLRSWLSAADSPRAADLIFVLAGKMDRKEFALGLFRNGLAPGILFSVGRFEIRRFSSMPLPAPLDLMKLAQDTPPSKRHYFVGFQDNTAQVQLVPPGRFGTFTEIVWLGRWLAQHPAIRSVLVISNDTHLRRIRLCCRSLLRPTVSLGIRPAPRLSPEQPQGSPLPLVSEVPLELLKLSIYWAGLKTGLMRFF